MTAVEKEELKTVIHKKIKSTQLAIADYREMTQPVAPDDAIGRLSRMDAINNKAVMESALREAESKLKRLEWALEHINDADFGLCTSCHQSIPFLRLKLMPESTRCVACG